MKKTIKAFTLIELLVVITIIALLVSILMPSLNKAKQQATLAVCLSSQKQLMAAYIMYTSDNNDSMVRPSTMAGHPQGHRSDWVGWPLNAAGNVIADRLSSTAEEEKRGLEKGALWKYYKDHNLLHCPGDKRSGSSPLLERITRGEGGWRSYSIVGTLNNRTDPDANGSVTTMARFGLRSGSSPDNVISKYSRIKMPQEKYVFLEEADHRGINMDEWLIHFDQTGYNATIDSIGIFHNDKGTFSYADGHADAHQWKVKETIKWFNQYLKERTTVENPDWPGRPTAPPCPSPNEDIKWLIDHAPQAAVPAR